MKIRRLSLLVAALPMLAAAQLVPGYLTDESADWREVKGSGYVTPECLRFPYISTYYVEPTVLEGESAKIRCYVTDFEHSKVRFGDDSKRFNVICRWTCDYERFDRKLVKGVGSGDVEFELGALPVGVYQVGVTCADTARKLLSHTVWQEFRVVPRNFRELPAAAVKRVSESDLEKYGIVRDPGRERIVLVPSEESRKACNGNFYYFPSRVDAKYMKHLDAWLAEHPHVEPKGAATGYTVYVCGYGDQPVDRAFARRRLFYDREVLRIPDDFTLDLGGATLKLNGFAGCKAFMVRLPGVKDSHVVNGTIEGDYWEHDYDAKESQASEWVDGGDISGESSYCSFENVKFLNITGYGACNGMSAFGRSPVNTYGTCMKAELCGKDGFEQTGENQWTTPLRDISRFQPWHYLSVSKELGYQGVRTRGWNYQVEFYDAATNRLSREVAFQYRPVLLPKKAVYARFTIEVCSLEEAGKCELKVLMFRAPRNCEFRNNLFERCRAVGLSPNMMRNFRFSGNEFRRCGDCLAGCAFDAEDGWDGMQDAWIVDNRFHDNNRSDIVTCAGHNFILERNQARIFLHPRTFSAVAARGGCGGATAAGPTAPPKTAISRGNGAQTASTTANSGTATSPGPRNRS